MLKTQPIAAMHSIEFAMLLMVSYSSGTLTCQAPISIDWKSTVRFEKKPRLRAAFTMLYAQLENYK
ncbi:hypothetical protein A8G00_15085 [Sphingobium sp. SA916]|nr:hypothetical protein A8G00_15085 [Sphingobium sp. SA916]